MTCRFPILAAFVCLPLTIQAQDIPTADLAALSRIWSATEVELSSANDGPELALLLDGDNQDMDLVVLAGRRSSDPGRVLHLVPGAAYRGDIAGGRPELAVNAAGSLQIITSQSNGWTPFEETLTLVERDGQLRVAGLTWHETDRGTLRSGICDWNLLTGDWQVSISASGEEGDDHVENRSGRMSMNIDFANWLAKGDGLPEHCRMTLSGASE
ncbi:hypothetical protein JJJ17_02595 [Paracoccus caeni]|uniref:Uncharacterized protein n=1 Tax=Paracoccus caeni TaxID=657651 RepID=A0A934SCJ1_9RHOB|nr:hypothetical protein [Paracoccus caeni]MBK4214809.1 hypothetical protein [Paracoccus caeni]